MKNAKNRFSHSSLSRALLIIGFLFFINPLFRGLDILPDVIGCLLIYFGLTQLAYFDGAVESARKGFLYLAIVEAIRLLMMKSVFLTPISSNRLLSATAFAIVEGFLYVMIFKQLFGGINYYSMRNDCNTTLAKCDGTAFITYLAFFIRLGASVIPELLALPEIYLYADEGVDISLEKLDAIADLIVARPLIELFFLLLALGVAVPWFISMCGLLRSFFKEAGDNLNIRYHSEYSSKPAKTRMKRLKSCVYLFYLALFFALDLIFNQIRIIPASAMFLLFFVGAIFLNKLCDFTKTIKFSSIAFIALLAAEIFRIYALPYKSVVIYQTPLVNVALGCVACIIVLPLCLLAVRHILTDLRRLAFQASGKEIETKGSWIAYCISAVLWSVGYCVPYLYASISTMRILASGIFIWQTVKVLSFILESEEERISLYGE